MMNESKQLRNIPRATWSYRKSLGRCLMILMLILLLVQVAACSGRDSDEPASPTIGPSSPSSTPEKQILSQTSVSTPTALETVEETSKSAPLPGDGTASAAEISPDVAPAWMPSEQLPRLFSQDPASPEQITSSNKLAEIQSPIRDDIELARIYGGWTGAVPTPPPAPDPLEIGTSQEIKVLNTDLNTRVSIQVDLLARSDHAYFWFDTGPGSINPSPTELEEVAQIFDGIYETSIALFGEEANPGVDGDPRLHIVNASPLALCDVTEEETDQCGLAGYFDHSNSVPLTVDPSSNAREMFVMNVDYFGREFYFNVLAHEFRHMIENNQDKGEIDWVAEGAAMLAEDLLGYPGVGLRRANMFLSEPDQQLNRWTDEDAKPHYGQGYLLNRYIFDRLGSEFYLQLSSAPEAGLLAIDTIARENGLEFSGIDIWLDWLAALAIHDRDNLPDRYAINLEGLDVAAMTALEDLPVKLEETVSQFAADYYLFEGGEDLAISFAGNSFVPVIGQPAASGDQMWLSDRANFRHMQLTRSFDLRDVETAALTYSVYHDIEAGYDFAYLFVSDDGGQTWVPLVAGNMKGTDPADDPSGSALAGRFYSGPSGGWLEERVDLTPYAGQIIQVRIAYITDLIHTEGGIAFDNISVPEIGFYDDSESLAEGWEAQGFERVTASIPQNWHLQLITFPDGDPEVRHLRLSPANTLELNISGLETRGGAILIVGATAPKTLLPAHYRLEVSE
jgi:hypothetical protein